MYDRFAIHFSDVSKTFQTVTALDKVSFQTARGSACKLGGPNGSGKSTLVRTCLGLTTPDGGTAHVGGHDLATSGARARAMCGSVLGVSALYDSLSAWENALFFGRMYGKDEKPLQERLEMLFRTFGIFDRRDETPSGWSQGMRQKIRLCRAFVHEPEILFLDEPTRSLDPESRERLWDYLTDQRNTRGITVLVVSHEPEDNSLEWDQQLSLKDGRLSVDRA